MKNIRSFLLIFIVLAAVSVAASAQTVLRSLDGAQIDVQGQNGKVVVLAIGATWLPLSAKQADYTNILSRKYAGKNVVIYFIATDSTNPKSKNHASDEAVRKWASANKLTVMVLRDSDGASSLRKFSVDQLPSFVVLDKSGNLSGEPFGGIDPKYDITVPISKKVDSLL
jgi:thiol-disulfide isomerase/thioredoxin